MHFDILLYIKKHWKLNKYQDKYLSMGPKMDNQ